MPTFSSLRVSVLTSRSSSASSDWMSSSWCFASPTEAAGRDDELDRAESTRWSDGGVDMAASAVTASSEARYALLEVVAVAKGLEGEGSRLEPLHTVLKAGGRSVCAAPARPACCATFRQLVLHLLLCMAWPWIERLPSMPCEVDAGGLT